MYIADLHIHSRYSRATSKDCIPEQLDLWARRKGIRLIGTGDFTHPAWREELTQKLVPDGSGLYLLREDCRSTQAPGEPARFVLSGEISCIYKKNDKVRKVHNLILLPDLEAAEILSRKLEAIGNIHSDGRPILGLDSRDLLEITLESCPKAIFIPAHIWTPHFSMFGAFSNFSSVEECFEDLTPYIHAMETGLSSDPPMNWRVSQLDRYQLVSNSDAHSPAKLGREANLLDTELSYSGLYYAIQEGTGLAGTIEFFPEEGKYHYDGHRSCNLCLKPAEAIACGGICPVCGKKLTIGVEHRVEELADRADGFRPKNARPYESLVPLPEVIAASTGLSESSKKTAAIYEELLRQLGNEFDILRQIPTNEIELAAGPCIAEGIRRLRAGKVERAPGYDGEYGTIRLLSQSEIDSLNGQFSLFTGLASAGKSSERVVKSPAPVSEEKSQNPAAPIVLNAEQEAAVTAVDPFIAVTAGPGTGKTRTLISRILHLIKNRGVKPGQITAVTFTNKAADEIRARLEQALGSKSAARGITTGTFHSISYELLCRAQPETALPDEFLLQEIAASVLRECGLKLKTSQFLRRVSAKKNGLPAERDDLFEDAFQKYAARLSERRLIDFDDLLLRALELCRASAKQERRFSYLLVDEFQDINQLQYELIRIWSQHGKSLFVIGDPDQSIYGFRGADARCFERLKNDHPDLRQIRLSENYRSTPEILACALPVISQNPGGTRLLHPHRSKGASVDLLTAQTPLSEGIFIAKEINRMVGGLDMLDAENRLLQKRDTVSCGFSDIAVLYRTHHQAALIEKCLKKENIPYVTVGRDDYLADPVVRGCIGFFRFLRNPGDMAALETTLKTLWSCPADLASGFSLSWNTACENKTAAEAFSELSAAYGRVGHLEPFFRLAPQFVSGKGKPHKLLERFFQKAGLSETEPLQKLRNTAVFYSDMPALLTALSCGEEADLVCGHGKSYTPGAVTLMTLHGAKGLEFPVVFLCGVSKGILPLESERHPSDTEEERRLFYVGMTRAKDKLLLLASPEPSPFLADIPEAKLVQAPVAVPKPRPDGVQLSLF